MTSAASRKPKHDNIAAAQLLERELELVGTALR